ncbi:hypothetical protein R1sor_024423 [Riccia sorocarpa]|uniref:Uncharacterized protein n=1 Tax=Riccia sorocarpa TaxID=122646 RepID=A0ABD3GQG2_9MARC
MVYEYLKNDVKMTWTFIKVHGRKPNACSIDTLDGRGTSGEKRKKTADVHRSTRAEAKRMQCRHTRQSRHKGGETKEDRGQRFSVPHDRFWRSAQQQVAESTALDAATEHPGREMTKEQPTKMVFCQQEMGDPRVHKFSIHRLLTFVGNQLHKVVFTKRAPRARSGLYGSKGNGETTSTTVPSFAADGVTMV